MALKLYIFETDEHNPHRNLAMERYLTLYAEPDSCLLYLWQNENTVVIGKNQNCYEECNIAELDAGGGLLARRLSGGGAVYHDLGNLNFSFIVTQKIYDVSRQLSVITDAVNSLGLPNKAEKTGRNDIEINGAKFSGNAFLLSENCCHHGTILISTDFDKLSHYLSVPGEKLASKGVKSVRSRVVNLSDLGDVSVSAMKKALYAAFEKVYNNVAKRLDAETFNMNELSHLYRRFSAKTWIYNDCQDMEYKVAGRFAWGRVEIGFNTVNGRISDIWVFTDALDDNLSETIKNTFTDRMLSRKALDVSGTAPEMADVSGLISKYCSVPPV